MKIRQVLPHQRKISTNAYTLKGLFKTPARERRMDKILSKPIPESKGLNKIAEKILSFLITPMAVQFKPSDAKFVKQSSSFMRGMNALSQDFLPTRIMENVADKIGKKLSKNEIAKINKFLG